MSEVRLLDKGDAAAFGELRLRAVEEETDSFLETTKEVQAKPATAYFENGWIAGGFMEHKLVGITGLYRHKGKKIEHKGTIWGVYVVPEARGQSMARRMMEMVLKEAKAAGIEQVHISTNAQNAKTLHLYQSLGFESYGVEKHIMKLADGSYIDDMWMVKFLK